MDAGDTRTSTRPWGRDTGVVDAEISGVCDHLDHDWMSRLVAARLADRARWRLIQQGRHAGVLDTDGQGRPPATGTPPGGIIAPILAQVSWHDALERGVATGVKRRGRGDACLIRDADDGGGACAQQAEADRFYEALGQRLGTCGLERSAEQTRGIPCRRQRPAAKTSVEGWGFEWRWGKDRAGKDPLGRRTSRPK